MVMKRNSEQDSVSRTKRSRSGIEYDDINARERLSSPESSRGGRGSSVEDRQRSSSLSRKNEDRTYTKRNNVRMNNNFQNDRRPRIERETSARVRVTNFAIHVADLALKEGLYHEFKKFGDVSVLLSGRGDDRYAYVNFRNADEAREARRNLERRRILLFDRPLNIEFDCDDRRNPNYNQNDFNRRPRSESPQRRTPYRQQQPQQGNYEYRERDDFDRRNNRGNGVMYSNQHEPQPHQQQDFAFPEEDPMATRTLFVGNLETTISSQDLRRVFERFGVVEDVDVKRPARGQGVRNTYAFVKFIDLNVASKAKSAMQGEYIGRNIVKVGYGKSMPTTRLWVGGLGPWTSLDELEREFDRFGAIRRIDYKKGDDHAFVLYDSLDAAAYAAREMRGFVMAGHKLRIDFADREQGVTREFEPEFQEQQFPPSPTPVRRDNDIPEQRYVRDDRNINQQSFNDRRTGPYSRNSQQQPQRQESEFNNWRNSDNNFHQNFERRDRSRESERVMRESSLRERKDQGWQSREPSNNRDRDWDRCGNENRDKNRVDMRQRGPRTPPENDFVRDRPPPQEMQNRNRNYRERPSQEKDFRDRSPLRHDSPAHKSPRENQRISPQSGYETHSNDESGGIKSNNSENRGRTRSADKLEENNEQDTKSPEISKNTSAEGSFSAGTETLQDMAKRFAVAWRGLFVLKNSSFPVRMHLVGGNPEVADTLLRSEKSSNENLLRITQRLRLDQPKLEEVTRRLSGAGASGHCLLLALPGGQPQNTPETENDENAVQQRPFRNLVTYLKQKQAAGVVNLPVVPNSNKDDVGVLHSFPPCQFSHDHLLRVAPHLGSEPSKEDHLVIVIIRGSG